MRKFFLLLGAAMLVAAPVWAQDFYPPRLSPAQGGQHVVSLTPVSYSGPAQQAPQGQLPVRFTPAQAQLVQFTSEEIKLYHLINQYRAQQGLPAVPLSRSLSIVAQTHVRDLASNYTSPSRPTACNLHSWSYRGPWKPVCYTPDHKNATGMWGKPAELTRYPGKGYEIAMRGWGNAPGGYHATAEDALHGWQQSPGHNNVMINANGFKSLHWNAMGVGMYKGYAVVWFGEEADPAPLANPDIAAGGF